MSIFNPWVMLGAILVIIGSYSYGHHQGYVECATENALQVAKMNEDSRNKEQQLQQEHANTAAKLVKDNADANKKIAKLNADVQSGSLRLSIAANCGVHAATDTGASSGNSFQARAELDGSTSQNLIAITNDGDSGIRQLNACIDAYNEVRDKYNQVVGAK